MIAIYETNQSVEAEPEKAGRQAAVASTFQKYPVWPLTFYPG